VLELSLLVKRWAKDRGVCHATKGHLPPYAWHLLTIFFLQCLGDEEGKDGLLPAFDKFDWSTSPVSNKSAGVCSGQGSSWKVPTEYEGLEAPELLKKFFRFYRYTVDWNREAVSLHRGMRGPLPKRLKASVIHPVNVAESSSYTPEFTFGDPLVALAIEDPWEPTRNLSADLTYFGVYRMKEELCRACNLCADNASLSKVLDPWVPPSRPDDKGSDDEAPQDGKKQEQSTAHGKAKPIDALSDALFARLKKQGEEQARKATEKLVNELQAADSSEARDRKTQELTSLLKDDQRLSELLVKKM
jgi:hypothetical protein